VVGTPAAGTVRVQFPGDFPIANANARFTLQGQTAAYREVTTAIILTRPLDDGNINNITAIGSLNAAAEFVVATAYDAATRVLTVIAGLNSQGNGGISGGLDVEITYGVAFVHNVETFTLPNRAFDNTSQTVTVTRDGATVANTFTIVGNILTITLDNVGGNINPWQGGDMVEVTYNQAIEGDSVTGTIGTIADPAGTNSQVINFTANFTAGGPGVTYSITSQGRMTEGDGNFTLNQITNEDFGFTVDYEAGGFYNLPAIRELRNEIEQLRLGTSAVTDTSVPFGFVPYPNANLNNNQTSSNVPTDSSLRFVLPPTTNHAFGELSFARQYSTTVFRGQNILRAVSMFYGGNEIGRNIGTSLFNPMHRAIFRGNQINWATTGGSTIRRGDTRIVDGGSTTSIFRTMEYVLTYARQYDAELADPFHPNTVPAPGQPLTQVAGFENFSGWGFGITAEDLGASTIWTSERDPNTNDRIGYNEFIVCFSRGDRTLNPSMAIDSCLALRRRFKYTDGELTGDNPLNRPLTTNADVGRYVASNFADFYEIVGGSMPRELVISDVASNNFWMQIFLLDPAESL
ncbi:MAG: hypothetical protein MPJ22_06565, partial [Pirellulales bacterium]|nr:hypothetical protein [Pirellulales bacterium]